MVRETGGGTRHPRAPFSIVASLIVPVVAAACGATSTGPPVDASTAGQASATLPARSPEATPVRGSPAPSAARRSVPLPPSVAALVARGPSGPIQAAALVRVVDGDTIIVRIGSATDRLRYIGMDAPESVKPNSPVEPFGPEASRANAALLDGQSLVLERDVSNRDRFGRLLRDVWFRAAGRWHLVDVDLVAEGMARIETVPPDVKYADAILATERAARAAGIGLWGGSP